MDVNLLTQAPPLPIPIEAVVIGVSAGAVDALGSILPNLPVDYPYPVIVVVHLPADRKSVLAQLFQAKCHVHVHEIDDKEKLKKGTVYFAPPDYHVLIEDDKRVSLSSEELVHYSRPAIDVLFESAADVFGPALVAVVLTGASADGAKGLADVHAAGGICLVQDPDQANSRTMPEAALKACPTAEALTLEQIANRLLEIARRQ
ncbi:MAG TPA: chemotaxis protein CheB [Schlesneria sp.]|jgi:two-component system chemotaxis response regulator CheB